MDNKPKILFCLPAFTFGGTVFSTLNMISFLKNEYDIYVQPMTYQGPIIEQYKNSGIKLLPESRILSAIMGRYEKEQGLKNKVFSIFHKSVRKISKYFNYNYSGYLLKKVATQLESKYSFDYVASCQEGGSTSFASYFSNSKRIAWFRSEYSIYKKQLNNEEYNREQEIYKKFDKIVCVSKVTRDDFLTYYPDLKDKIYAVHNIQFTDRILKLSNESALEFNQDDSFKIISVGRFAPQKRFSCIPRIVHELKLKGIDFTWYIIGDGNMEGEYTKTISEIDKLEVSDKVKCIGSRTNPYPYIKNADLMVVPSYYEACPRVVIEAKILHTPVVCADFSSAKEFVEHGVDGYIGDIDELSGYIGAMMENRNIYKTIKLKCDEYNIDNERIYSQLKNIFK